MKPRSILSRLTPYVPGKSIRDGIKLSSNENPLGSSPAALAAVRSAHDLNRYPDGGMHALRSALAEHWQVAPDMLLVGNGSDELMVMIAGAFIDPGTNAITAAHTFSQYTFATTAFGGDMRCVDMPEGRFDLPAMAARVDEDTRLMFVCNPNNPTSTMVTHEELAALMRSVPDHVVVVVDEAYGEFADDPEYPRTLELIRHHPNLVRLRTFSKIYGLAALRIGYATAQPELIGHISALRQPFNVGTIAQEAATAALSDAEFMAETKSVVAAGREHLCRALDSLYVPYFPPAANFVCGHFGPHAADVVAALAERGIAVRPLSSFGLPEHIRISVGNKEETSMLAHALTEILGTP
jgi:histidinol-phosphate aminotransferase